MTTPPLGKVHARLTATWRYGALLTPSETASFSLNIASPAGDTNALTLSSSKAARQQVVESLLAGPFSTFTTQCPGISTSTHLWSLKYAIIGADGKYTDDAVQAFFVGTPPTGQATSPLHPTQNTVVASLQTDRNGPSSRGRIYLPVTAAQVDLSNYLIPTTIARDIAGAATTLINAVNANAEFGNGTVSVISPTKGIATPVKKVVVGRVYDTMRSRRRDMTEGYVGFRASGGTEDILVVQ